MAYLRGPLGPVLLLLLYVHTGPVLAIPLASPVFINEFHYDNDGTDSGEFVELVGPGGTDLTGWQLLLYNGSNGAPYGQIDLAGVLADDTGTGFGFQLIGFPSNGLQNGAADGLALLDDAGTVLEFLSYEGVLTAVTGGAAGLTSRDVLVSETNATPIGASLQRVGRGSVATDFVWMALQQGTPGYGNNDQLLVAGPVGLSIGMPWPLWLTGLLWLALRGGRTTWPCRHLPGVNMA